MGSNPIGGTLFNCSLPLAADRALDSAYFVVARRRKSVVCSLLLSTAARDPGLNCSLPLIARSARCGSRFGFRLLRRRSQTEKRCLLAPPQHGGARSGFNCSLPLAADRALDSAYFVVARRRKSVVCSLLLSTAARDPGLDC